MLGVQFILAFITALLFSLAIIPVTLRVAAAYGLFDLPDSPTPIIIQTSAQTRTGAKSDPPRRIHSKPIPRLGGIAIVVGFFLSVLVGPRPTGVTGIFAASLLLFATGLCDDIKPLSAKLRLVLQLLSATLAVWSSKLIITTITLTPHFAFNLPMWLGFIVSIFIVVGAVNAVNMIDGLDGLAGGVVLIGVCLLSYLHFLATQDLYLLLVFSVPLIGAILGFLKYNTHPACIFMGDCGSNWLGFMVGILFLFLLCGAKMSPNGSALIYNSEHLTSGKTLPFLSVVLCMALPIFDTAWVILGRIRDGLSPMTPDKRHFHHGLLKLGLSHPQSVAASYFIALVFGVVGAVSEAFPQHNTWWLPFLSASFLFALMPAILKLDEGALQILRSQRIQLSRSSSYGPKLGVLIRYWETANRYTIYVILLAIPIFAGVPPKVIGYAAAASIFLLIMSVFFKSKQVDFFQSLILVVASTVLLAANNANEIFVQVDGQKIYLQFIYNSMFIWLAVSTLCFVIVTFRKQYFLITPSDFLMVMFPLLLLIVPQPYNEIHRLNIIGLRSLVLFMAIRSMVKRHVQVQYRLRLVLLVATIFVFCVSVIGVRVVY